jgi:hypothetical protein
MRNYRDLQVWSKAQSSDIGVVSSLSRLPRAKRFTESPASCGGSSLNRSEPARRLRRRTSTELARFVRIAMGSASELDYHLLLSRDIGFMNGDDFTTVSTTLTEVRKMLTSFLQSVEEQIEKQSRAAGRS